MTRKNLIRDLLHQEHFGPMVEASGPAKPSELALQPAWCLQWDPPETSLIARTRNDFREFCSQKFGLHFADKGDARIRWTLKNTDDPAAEGFTINVTASEVLITAESERGLLHATHYIEHMMADRGGPFLPLGEVERNPSLSPRFTEGTFVPANQTPDNPGDFSNEYLSLMSHFGGNALKFYINLHELWRSDSLPELNTDLFDANIMALRNFARRTRDFGIDLYLHLNAPPLPHDHPIFMIHPDVRGAQVEIFLEELSGKPWHALCSSHERVRQGYAESLQAVFRAAPELAGAVMIVGGECFFHCFTRSTGEQLTNCPRCRSKEPHKHVAHLVNTLHDAVNRSGENRSLFAWPYSAFTWSREDSTQSKWIHYLDQGVKVLCNFDCFDWDLSTGGMVRLFDYNIKLIGPSSVFVAQAGACRERGLEIFAKTETNTTVDTFFLPHLPVYFRWFERFRAIRESGARGFMGQWRFYGMNGSIPEELQYHSVWNPDARVEDLLATIAKRDFALDSQASASVVFAWRQMSDAWDDFPWSAITAGEREGYMRGPWYLGPAHPLIFNVQDHYHLGSKFYKVRGDIAEMVSETEVSQFSGKPRYVSDLLICLPFGVHHYLHLVSSCRERWQEGVATLCSAIGSAPTKKARRELGICEMIGIHLQSLENTVRFYSTRDSLGQAAAGQSDFESIIQELQKIAKNEIANATRSLPILESDPRIGFGYTYGEVYDSDMVREKIAQCHYLVSNELGRIESLLRFHIWQKFP
jgi:hypothetical protein